MKNKFNNNQELEFFLENEFIPQVIKLKQKSNKASDSEIVSVISLDDIKDLNLNSEQLNYTFKYLNIKNIIIDGLDKNSIELEDYNYIESYKNMVLPKSLSKKEIEEKIVIWQATKDPVIKEQIVLSNINLVTFWALNFSNYSGIDKTELEQYGYEGLLKALPLFDSSKGTFVRYASKCIKRSIYTGIAEENRFKRGNEKFYTDISMFEKYNNVSIKDDPYLIKYVGEYGKARMELEKKYQQEITDEQLASFLDVSVDKIKNYNQRIAFASAISLDEQLEVNGNDIDITPITNNSDMYENYDPTSEALIKKDLKNKIESILDVLNERERKIIDLLYGLEGETVKDYKEVAEIIGVKPLRIKQIEAKALVKLRYPEVSKNLNVYLEDEPSVKRSI